MPPASIGKRSTSEKSNLTRNISLKSRAFKALWSLFTTTNQSGVLSKSPSRLVLDFSDAAQDGLQAHFLMSLHCTIGSSTKHRVVIAEDLCSDLAQALNNAFGLSHEVCEDYLVNSGWNELNRYVDTESNHWPTRRLEQENITLRWYRPGTLNLRHPGEPNLELSRTSVLQAEWREIRTYELEKGQRRVRPVLHSIEVATNVWRRHIDLHLQEDGPFQEGDPLAWEERLRIWRRQVKEVAFIILLAGPSPLAIASERFAAKIKKKLPDEGFCTGTDPADSGFEDLDEAIDRLSLT